MLHDEEFNLHATITVFCGNTLTIYERFNMLGLMLGLICS